MDKTSWTYSIHYLPVFSAAGLKFAFNLQYIILLLDPLGGMTY